MIFESSHIIIIFLYIWSLVNKLNLYHYYNVGAYRQSPPAFHDFPNFKKITHFRQAYFGKISLKSTLLNNRSFLVCSDA